MDYSLEDLIIIENSLHTLFAEVNRYSTARNGKSEYLYEIARIMSSVSKAIESHKGKREVFLNLTHYELDVMIHLMEEGWMLVKSNRDDIGDSDMIYDDNVAKIIQYCKDKSSEQAPD